MISIVLYNLSKSFYDYRLGKESVYVAPGPAQADALRTKLTDPNAEVITIAQFLLELLEQHLGPQECKNYQSKSQLLLTMGLAWKQLQASNYAQFKNAFMLLTDLRGYTQDKVLLDSLLEEFDPTLAQIVVKMNSLIEILGVLDEHAAYSKLSQVYQSHFSAENSKTYCFWGFDFLSPVQVDFLKSFAAYHKVVIPLPYDVFNQAVTSDWIQWLGAEEENIVKIDNAIVTCLAPVNTYPKGYLPMALKQLLESEKSQQSVDLYIASKNIGPEQVQLIPSSEHFYKVPVSIFNDKLVAIDKMLKRKLSENNFVDLAGFTQLITQGRKESLKNKDYLSVKVYEIYAKVLESWRQLTDKAFVFDWFASELMKEIVALDLPRLSLMPLQQSHQGKILGLKDLHFFDGRTESWVCVADSFLDGRAAASPYSNEVETKLLQIGPLRRGGLEELFIVSRLKEILCHENSRVLIESGIRENNQIWNDLLLGQPDQPVPLSYTKSQSLALPSVQIGKEFNLLEVTPSKLQSYANCARKFYHDYLDGLFPKIKLENHITPMHAGELAHGIIQQYVSSQGEMELEGLIERSLQNLYQSNNMEPALDIHFEYVAQLRLKTTKVAQEILKLTQLPGSSFQFENKINYQQGVFTKKGKFDFFLNHPHMQLLLDFKSSNYGVPTFKEMWSHQQLQLWFYFSLMEQLKIIDLNRPVYLGYINLTSPEDSIVIKMGEEQQPEWTSGLSFFSRVSPSHRPIFELLEEYRSVEAELLERIKNERDFAPVPASAEICKYCPLNVVCPRNTQELHV